MTWASGGGVSTYAAGSLHVLGYLDAERTFLDSACRRRGSHYLAGDVIETPATPRAKSHDWQRAMAMQQARKAAGANPRRWRPPTRLAREAAWPGRGGAELAQRAPRLVGKLAQKSEAELPPSLATYSAARQRLFAPETTSAAPGTVRQMAWPRATGPEQGAKPRPVRGRWASGAGAEAPGASGPCLARSPRVGPRRRQAGRARPRPHRGAGAGETVAPVFSAEMPAVDRGRAAGMVGAVCATTGVRSARAGAVGSPSAPVPMGLRGSVRPPARADGGAGRIGAAAGAQTMGLGGSVRPLALAQTVGLGGSVRPPALAQRVGLGGLVRPPALAQTGGLGGSVRPPALAQTEGLGGSVRPPAWRRRSRCRSRTRRVRGQRPHWRGNPGLESGQGREPAATWGRFPPSAAPAHPRAARARSC